MIAVPKRNRATKADFELQTKLGAVISGCRYHLGITQEELAWRANLHRTYIADVERGARNMTVRIVANIARALELTVGQLFTAACAPAGAALHPNGSPLTGKRLALRAPRTSKK